MEESSLSISWDALTCSICLDILKHPVSLQCGHSFCLKCITDSWDEAGVCRCPHCRKTFTQRPDLCINIHLANAVEKLNMASQNRAGPDDIECSFCSEVKLKAVKSCLTCLASYCEIHIQPHNKISTLKNHNLVNPTRNIENYMCSQHQKALELFCTDHCVCICSSCVADKHKNHHTVLPERERAKKQSQLEELQRNTQDRISDRQKQIEVLKQTIKNVKGSVETEEQQSMEVLKDLIDSIEETCQKITQLFKDQENKEVERFKEPIERLKNEIEVLNKRDSELTELSETDNDIYFLQTFPSVSTPIHEVSHPSVDVSTDFSGELLRKELSHLKQSVEEISQWEFVEETEEGHHRSTSRLRKSVMRSTSQHSVTEVHHFDNTGMWLGNFQKALFILFFVSLGFSLFFICNMLYLPEIFPQSKSIVYNSISNQKCDDLCNWVTGMFNGSYGVLNCINRCVYIAESELEHICGKS
ncbi:E3 ubiquitin-protein ligase TRIM47-like [Polypterus senegalus]|uniref:E3 ubiquitin-protein ligase TRIM47-like n=1 Tax=Polypterus senegalus TaxID=55291 RepID=UPI00196502D3|nr:E3 ubiquitin-protein ligase TRIM47-like [Polypterus senegalus]